MIDSIIEELDEEGINLQEIKLNLIHQGYKQAWEVWIKSKLIQALYLFKMNLISS